MCKIVFVGRNFKHELCSDQPVDGQTGRVGVIPSPPPPIYVVITPDTSSEKSCTFAETIPTTSMATASLVSCVSSVVYFSEVILMLANRQFGQTPERDRDFKIIS